jgi:hypothetical protein
MVGCLEGWQRLRWAAGLRVDAKKKSQPVGWDLLVCLAEMLSPQCDLRWIIGPDLFAGSIVEHCN